MNTKFFLLIAAFLLLSNPTTPANINAKNENSIRLAAQAQTQTIASVNAVKSPAQNFPPAAMLRTSVRARKDDYIIDDDGKFHQVHYERMPEHKTRRLLCIFLSASLLSLVYICTLIANHIHLVH